MSTLIDLWVAESTVTPRAPLESFSDQRLGAKDQPTVHTTLKQEQSNRFNSNKWCFASKNKKVMSQVLFSEKLFKNNCYD